MRIPGGIGNNSSKTVLNTQEPAKIKSKETSKQGITVVKTTSNQGVCSQKSSFTCEILSESLKIPDLNKRSLTTRTSTSNDWQMHNTQIIITKHINNKLNLNKITRKYTHM